MVAAWCFLLDIGPQSLGPRREVDIALRSLLPGLGESGIEFLQHFAGILMHFVSPFFLDTLKKSKKKWISNRMSWTPWSPGAHSKPLCRRVGVCWRVGSGQDSWMPTVKGIETPQEMQRWAAFFLFPKIPNEVNFNGVAFQSRFATVFGDATPHIKTPQKITKAKNEKPKRHPFPSCPTYSHTKTFPTFPYSITVRLSPKPVSGCGHLPYPF